MRLLLETLVRLVPPYTLVGLEDSSHPTSTTATQPGGTKQRHEWDESGLHVPRLRWSREPPAIRAGWPDCRCFGCGFARLVGTSTHAGSASVRGAELGNLVAWQ